MSWLDARNLPLFFVAATLLPVAVLGWLGVRTLDQDRDAERQRRRDALEVAAGRVAIDIEQDLQRIEAQLANGNGIQFLADRIVTPHDTLLLFRPDVPSVSVLSSDQLSAAAQQAYRNPSVGITAYERIVARRGDPDRGEALVALGALLRGQHPPLLLT